LLAAVGGYVWVQRRARRYTLRFAYLTLLERIAPRRPGWPRHIPAALLMLALRFLTVGLAGPTANAQVPRDRATVMLVVDVSLSMNSTDVRPTRLTAAQDAAISFVRSPPPGINLGVESFAGSPTVLVSPTTDRDLAVRAIQTLKLAESTATGEAIAAALNAIHAVNQLIPGQGQGPPPARIVLMSDGKQNTGRDEFTMATSRGGAHPDQHHLLRHPLWHRRHPTRTSPGARRRRLTRPGRPTLRRRVLPGPKQPADPPGVYDTLAHQIGYQTVHRDVSKPWLALGAPACLAAAAAALLISQRLPA
jgi:Ca-activated chloride channel family protein